MTSAGTAVEVPWDDTIWAAAAFAVDPVVLGGVSVRSRPGPGRDRWLALLRTLLPPAMPMRRLPPHVAEARLLGGLDLAATLRARKPIAEHGILAGADGGILVAAMAERLTPTTVAHLAACLDAKEVVVERDGFAMRLPAAFGVVALDEGIEDERPSAVLSDRLAFHLDLDGVDERGISPPPDRRLIEAARARLAAVEADPATIEAICGTALVLGVFSIRPSHQALGTARAIAALAGHPKVLPEDAALAARLVLAPRATRLPTAPPDAAEPPGEPEAARQEPGDRPDDSPPSHAETPLDDVVLAAARAAIPAGMLARLRLPPADRKHSSASGRSGASQHSPRAGRPAGVRRGAPRGGLRLNLIETLRAAAPWQRLRREQGEAGLDGGDRIAIRHDDFRVTRLKRRGETTTIFVVDASGSSAMHRLSEAKGAVEQLLGECYVRRDQVALVAFRGQGAVLLLPSTRSLTRAKRCLASLPGGGGTPLAAGIDAAAALADAVRRQGRAPIVILMTDGRANIDRQGRAGRPQAAADATAAARALRSAGFAAMLVDTSPSPQVPAARLAHDMGALYLPLPYADASLLSRTARSAAQQARDTAPAGSR